MKTESNSRKPRRGKPSRKVATWLPLEKADAVRRHAQMAGMSEAAYVAEALDRYMGKGAKRPELLVATTIHAGLIRLRAAVVAAGKGDAARVEELQRELARIEAMMRELTPLVHQELGP